MKKLSKILLVLLIPAWVFPSLAELPGQAARPGSATTGGPQTFVGRRGKPYTAVWEVETYTAAFSTLDGSFPWDWISFVGERGAAALAGHPQVHSTLAFSEAHALAGVQPGDIMRVKAWDTISLAHLSKIGIVFGSGPEARRHWLGSGLIQEYVLAPDSVGYTVQLEGRTIQVRLSHLLAAPLQVVGVVRVSIDDPVDARLYFVSDLEPSDRYQQAVEYRDDLSTLLSFDAEAEAVQAVGTGNITAYLYSSSPLLSWSASDLLFDEYLQVEDLDQLVRPDRGDGRVALQTAALPEQYFYIGNQILPGELRSDPEGLQAALRQQRLEVLQNLPILSQPEQPGFEFVSFLSNLFLSYLVNPDGNIHYTDKVFPYTADNLMIMTEAPEILPAVLVETYRDYLARLGEWQYTSPSQGLYWWRADVSGHPPLPGWYAGNIPEIVFRSQHDSVSHRYQYSDLFATAEYLIAMAAFHRISGDTAFMQAQETVLLNALKALQNYNRAYKEEDPLSENYYPHVVVPMSDLYYTEGVYPAESALAVYAYEDAIYLMNLIGKNEQAAELQPLIDEMREGFADFFWSEEDNFFLPRRDQRSSTGSGVYYRDFWSHTLYPLLTGDIGKEHLGDILEIYDSALFLDADRNFRWLSTHSENYRPDSDFVDGYVMEGGFFNGAPNAAPAIGYYQLGMPEQAQAAAQELYAEVWARMGPYETMRQWEEHSPGLYLETSIYIESLISTLWLIKEAMGVQVEGSTVTIAPRIAGEFFLSHLNLAAQGKRAVINYSRDASGCEHLQVLSNTGLTIAAPGLETCSPELTPTPISSQEHFLFLALVSK